MTAARVLPAGADRAISVTVDLADPNAGDRTASIAVDVEDAYRLADSVEPHRVRISTSTAREKERLAADQRPFFSIGHR